MENQSAIHHQRLTRNHLSIIRGQKDNGTACILRCEAPFEDLTLLKFLKVFRPIDFQSRVALDQAQDHGVDVDVKLAKFGCDSVGLSLIHI